MRVQQQPKTCPPRTIKYFFGSFSKETKIIFMASFLRTSLLFLLIQNIFRSLFIKMFSRHRSLSFQQTYTLVKVIFKLPDIIILRRIWRGKGKHSHSQMNINALEYPFKGIQHAAHIKKGFAFIYLKSISYNTSTWRVGSNKFKFSFPFSLIPSSVNLGV